MHRLSSIIRSYRRETFLYLICFIYLIFVIQIVLPSSFFNRIYVPHEVSVPHGFYEVLNRSGVKVYQKNYQSGAPDFVTLVDLKTATIRSLTGTINGELVERKKLSEFWDDAASQNVDDFEAQVVINGTFFDNGPSSNAAVAFGLKVRNHLITYGYGLNEYPGSNKTLAFNSFAGNAKIQSYSRPTFNSSIPDVIGALAPQADKSAVQRLGRTFAGTINNNRDSTAKAVLFFSSPYSTQANAEAVLKRFGATEVVMLDGGGSTGLIIAGTAYIRTDRLLPHAIAIYSGKPETAIVGANDQCLDVTNSLGLIRSLTLVSCNGSISQRWSFIQGNLRGANNQCLEVRRENPNGGREVQLRRCNQSIAQRWMYDNERLQTANYQCLDAGEQDTARNIKVLIRPCSDRASQRWQRVD